MSAFLMPVALVVLAAMAGWAGLSLWGRTFSLQRDRTQIRWMRGAPNLAGLWFAPPDGLVGVREQAGRVTVLTWSVSEGRLVREVTVDPGAGAAANGTAAFQSPVQQRPRVGTSATEPLGEKMPVEPPLAWAVSPSGERLAWASGGQIYIKDLPDGRPRPVLAPLRLGRLPVSVAFLSNGLLAVKRGDGEVGFLEVERGRFVDWKPVRGPCQLETYSEEISPWSISLWVVNACPGPERVDAFQVDVKGGRRELIQHSYAAGWGGRTAVGVSPRGRLAVGLEDGTVRLLTPESGAGSGESTLTAPGVVRALAFNTEDSIMVGGDFRGIYLLSEGAPPQVLVPGVLAKRLAAAAVYLAYPERDRLMLEGLDWVRTLNGTGRAIRFIWIVLAIALVSAPAGRLLLAGKVRPVAEAGVTGTEEESAAMPLPEPPPELIEACVAGNCVLYAGAGLSAQAGLPIWAVLVRSLYEWAAREQLLDARVSESLRRAVGAGLWDLVADGIVSALGGREGLLQDYLKATFLGPSPRLQQAHRLLRQVPFSAVLTTNFDDLLERTFEDRRAAVYTQRDAEALLQALTRREFFVLKLYGSLEQPESVLLAPAQFRDALTRYNLFSKFVESLLVSRTILFVGASLEGIEAYLSGISFQGVIPQTHYALVDGSGAAWEAKAESLARRYNIQVLPYAPGEGYPEVPEFLQRLAQAVKARSATGQAPAAEAARLKSVALENIGPFDYVSLELTSAWNVLLGDNGVGKSTVLKAIAVAVCGRDAEPYAERLIKAGKPYGTITLVTDQGKSYTTKLVRRDVGAEVVSLPSRPLEAEGWLVLGFPPLRSVTWARPRSIPREGLGWSTAEDLLPLIKGEADPRLDKLKEWIVRLDAQAKDYQVRHSPRGPGKLPKTRYEEQRDELFWVIGQLTPGLKVEFGQVRPGTFEVTVITDDGEVPIEAVSQGTTSIVGWAGVLLERLYDLYGPKDGAPAQTPAGTSSSLLPRQRYAMVLIDEIDAHMHPAWQQGLPRNLAQVFPGAQFIATTHSPLIVSSLAAGQILRVYRDPAEAKVVIRRPESDVRGWRADQILIDPLFGLETAREPETEALLARYTELAARDDLSEQEKGELERAAQLLKTRLPLPAERAQAREAAEMVRAVFQERLKSMPPDERKRLLDEVEVQVQEIITGSRRQP